MRDAVFLDKDGTLITDISYNVNTELIRFELHAFEALRLLQEHDFLLVIVTNQSGIALEYFTEEDVQRVNKYMKAILREQGILLNGFYYCPHHPDGKAPEYAVDCSCRKPAPGLLFRAAADLNINLRQSWMVGDILHDIEAGNRAGCETILIDNGHETEWMLNPARQPNYTVGNLLEAAKIIVHKKLAYGSKTMAEL